MPAAGLRELCEERAWLPGCFQKVPAAPLQATAESLRGKQIEEVAN